MLTLVLDDYHIIESPSIHEGLAFLVEHMPSQVRLIIATRTDPPLPLARMRVRSQLLELRSADLRFTPPQIASFFTEVMGLTLTADGIPLIEDGLSPCWRCVEQVACTCQLDPESCTCAVQVRPGSRSA